MTIHYLYDDGGRAEAGFKGHTTDCSCRAIAIALQEPYDVIYAELNYIGSLERITKRRPKRGSARTGVRMTSLHSYLKSKGWTWVPTMGIGTGTHVHLRESELPKGRIICRVSGHLCAVIDGVIHDTHDPSRDGKRAVYGYWAKGSSP